MNFLDWSIMVLYLGGMIGLSYQLGKKQTDANSYYLGGNNLSWWSIGISTMATQCSTNSLLGAPAFILTTGMLWMQYEFAVPLAMIPIMIFLLPFYRKLNLVSVYEYLEMRFGVGTRTLLSIVFQFLRAFGTGVTVYGISIVLQEILGIDFVYCVLVLGVVTIIYDLLGGMEAVVLSDVIQMGILYLGILLCLIYSLSAVGGVSAAFELFPQTGETLKNFFPDLNLSFEGLKAIDFSGHGFGDGKTFTFLPMFFGGLFLYISYYGCDQTQVQRELSSKNCDDTNLSLFLNGLLRFPLVLTYCLLGVCIGAYIVKNPHFLNSLVEGSGEPNFNLAVPRFILQNLPHGVIGIMMVSLFSAAMSSLDSTINSLSATTTRDLYERFLCPQGMDGPTQLKVSRIFTVFWGVVCVAFSFFVGGISPSIIESVNKVGSLGNGPILALFVLGILTRFVHGTGAVCGLLGGFAFNAYLWINEPQVSWLWWNVTGFVVAVGISLLVSALIPSQRRKPESLDGLVFESGTEDEFHYERNWPRYHAVLLGYTVLMITACWLWTSSFN